QWTLTRSFAVNVATGGSPEGNVEPVLRIRLEQLSRAAELEVAETTGLPLAPDGRRLACVAVGRADWTVRALDSWRQVLDAMSPPAPAPGAPATTARPGESAAGDPAAVLGGLLGQWASTIGPLFFGLQVGSVVGHLAQRALGQYPLAVPWAPSEELLLVLDNVAAFARDWSLPEEEALLWVCAREMASNAVLSRPHVRARMLELLTSLARSSAAAQVDLAGRLEGLLRGSGLPGLEGDFESGPGPGADLESLQGMLGDPEALLAELLTPEARRSSDQLTSLAVVVDAYADHVADLVGRRLVGSSAQLAEAWYRRRIERGKGEEAAGALFGLDLEREQVDRGRAFVSGVLARAGEDGLGRLWESVRTLPTPAEVDAPGLWLERISLPELDEGEPGRGAGPPGGTGGRD
ncbi:MAG TPA: zinc-dependent metalloprotease, partial [Acidimicrobiales bacterium]|nr:zinc-dependent metalloprotease [Acidimicrobiales bacterium]